MVTPFIGEIRMFGGNFAPKGWALCDGSLLNTNDNPELFSLLGTIYGGNGRTTFGLPDLRGRIPIGAGQGLGLTNRSIGATGGSETASLTESNVPSHTHRVEATTDTANQTSPSGNVLAQTATPIYTTGGAVAMSADAIPGSTAAGASFNNVMPSTIINFIIALTGRIPSQT